MHVLGISHATFWNLFSVSSCMTLQGHLRARAWTDVISVCALHTGVCGPVRPAVPWCQFDRHSVPANYGRFALPDQPPTFTLVYCVPSPHALLLVAGGCRIDPAAPTLPFYQPQVLPGKKAIVPSLRAAFAVCTRNLWVMCSVLFYHHHYSTDLLFILYSLLCRFILSVDVHASYYCSVYHVIHKIYSVYVLNIHLALYSCGVLICLAYNVTTPYYHGVLGVSDILTTQHIVMLFVLFRCTS